VITSLKSIINIVLAIFLVSLFLFSFPRLHAQKATLSETDTISYLYQRQSFDTNKIMQTTHYLAKLVDRGRASKMKISDSLVPIYYKLITASIKAGFPKGLVESLNDFGVYYYRRGSLEQAMKYYNCAALVAEKFSLPGAANANINIAGVLLCLNQYDKAFLYLDKAEVIVRKNNDYRVLQHIMENKGAAYNERKQFDKSKVYYEKGLDLAFKHNLSETLKCLSLSNLGNEYLHLNMPEKALPYLLKIQTLNKAKISPFDMNYADATLGSAYMTLKNYPQASFYYNKALKTGEQINDGVFLFNLYESLSDLYTATNNPKQALVFYRKRTELKDSLENEKIIENTNQLEVKYRTAEKDKAIAQQQLMLTRSNAEIKEKNFWIWGIATCSIFVSILFFASYRSYKHRQYLQETTIINMQQEQKIGQLAAIMNGEEKERKRIARELHDGVGGLLSAAKMNFNVFYQDYETSPIFKNGMQLLDDAYNDLRQTAHNLLPEIVLKEGLVKAVHLYCTRISMGQDLIIDFQTFGELIRFNNDTELSLYRIIQELVHNIIKHARASKVLVQLGTQDNQFMIAVEDNGIGIPETKMGTGMGMENLSARVAALGGEMEIDSRKNIGTTIYLEFDMQKLQQKAAV
jgi:two-component system, NarL family, sensor kinase